LGSHQIDIYNWFLGANPSSVIASGRTNYYDKKSHEWYDTVMTVFEYETAQGSVSALYQTISSNGSEGYFEKFMGDQGTLTISEVVRRCTIYPESRAIDAKNWIRCIKEGHLKASKEIVKAIDNLTLDQLAKIFTVDETPFPGEHQLPKPKEQPSLKIPVKVDKPIHMPHLENFFGAIRGEAKLNCPADIGYETAVAVLKVNEAAEAGRKLSFQPDEFKA
jgi:predicted dehydrogenase